MERDHLDFYIDLYFSPGLSLLTPMTKYFFLKIESKIPLKFISICIIKI